MPNRPSEPRLAWAYVRERAAVDAAAPLPELGSSATRILRPEGGTAEPYRLSPVTLWAHLPPRARPSSLCPVCLEPVTLKLGAQRRHHYAHPPESTCRAATPEGALHLAAKLRLAEELRPGGTRLLLRRLCNRAPQDRGSERCAPAATLTHPLEWDDVEVERSLPSVRADLVLLHRGRTVLAVEVYATHEVDLEKGERYRAMGVPWLEVSAAHLLPDGATPWIAGEPLPVLGDSFIHPDRWRCPRHQALYAAWEEYQRNGVHRFAWRLVHIYRGDGGRSAGERRTDTVLLSMMERREEGRVVGGWLQRDERDEPLHRPLELQGRVALRQALHGEFLRWARWTREERGAVVDSPMRWCDEPLPRPAQRDRLYPQRLRSDPRTRETIGAPGLPSISWPLPLASLVEPHPLFGSAPVYWTDLAVGDQGPMLHAIVPPIWLTLQPHEWVDPEARSLRARADVSLHHHDGRRWRAIRKASFSHSWSPAGPISASDWGGLLRGIATTAAECADAIAAGRSTLQGLVEAMLP